MRARFVHVRIRSTAMADMWHDFGHFQLPITLLFMVRNIKCGYSFSKLGRAEHVETKFGRIRRIFLVCIKIAYRILDTVKYLHLNDAAWYEV